MSRREITDTDKMWHKVWSCAFRREYDYRKTDMKRSNREFETVQMCLKIGKWWKFAEEK
jgi:hypothetical protein